MFNHNSHGNGLLGFTGLLLLGAAGVLLYQNKPGFFSAFSRLYTITRSCCRRRHKRPREAFFWLPRQPVQCC